MTREGEMDQDQQGERGRAITAVFEAFTLEAGSGVQAAALRGELGTGDPEAVRRALYPAAALARRALARFEPLTAEEVALGLVVVMAAALSGSGAALEALLRQAEGYRALLDALQPPTAPGPAA